MLYGDWSACLFQDSLPVTPCLHITSKCSRYTCNTGSCHELHYENILFNILDIKSHYPSQASNNATKAAYVKS